MAGPSALNSPNRSHDLENTTYMEAQSHDKALVETWDESMEKVASFAGLLVVSLTSFLILSLANLTPQPDVVVIILWVMGLVSSFTVWVAAGMARDSTQEYVKASEKHEDPLECARVRHYLYEGMVKWHMPVMIITIAILAHIAASLLLAGIVIFLFHRSRASGISATVIIFTISTLYIVFTIAPLYYPHFPYRTLLSRTVRSRSESPSSYRVTHGRTLSHQDRSNGREQTRVSTDMEDHIQVAKDSDESNDRTKRDAGAIHSAVDDLTYLEGIKLKPFVLGASSSFNSNRGKQVGEVITADEDNRGSGTHTPQPNEVKELALVVTCFVSKPWWFSPMLTQHDNTTGDLSSLITRLLKTCTDPGFDAVFAVRWTCMSLVAVRRMLTSVKVTVQCNTFQYDNR
ncbi:hypothetical protein EDB84DRAFT_1599831 [Lactarius hengduanensis]|nr:hypothetical protein EDB84DRAFT_1599831 [Lactarius hengduanensis]